MNKTDSDKLAAIHRSVEINKLEIENMIDIFEKKMSIVENKLIDIGKIKFDEIRKDHILDYSNQYNRIKLDLHAENKNTIPTNQRLLEVQNGGKDLGLIELYFNYGRYFNYSK